MPVRKTDPTHLKLPASERFYRKVHKNEVTGCWEWLGAMTQRRNGKTPCFRDDVGKPAKVIRWVLELATGESGRGKHASHRCNNSQCVNPEHLYWGSPLENAQDWKTKWGTRPWGKKP